MFSKPSVWELAPLLHCDVLTAATDFVEAMKASKKTIALPPWGLTKGPLFPWVCWTLWTTRNQKIFENRSITEEDTLSKAIGYARGWQEAQSSG